MSTQAIARLTAHAKMLREGQAPHQQQLAADIEEVLALVRLQSDKGAGGGTSELEQDPAAFRPMTATELEEHYTVADLREIAGKEQIDLTGLALKHDIAAAIVKARKKAG